MFNINNIIGNLLFTLPAIVIALTFHEYAHALVAYACGDMTAKNAGRLTLNPFKHLDLLGTLLLIIASFGWAKPVPINPLNFRGNRQRKIMLVSVAGPLMNLLEALVGAVIFALIYRFAPYNSVTEYFYYFFNYFIQINIILAVFNILPISPLDGSKILAGFLPYDKMEVVFRYERYGMLVLIILMFTGVLGKIITPVSSAIFSFLMRLCGVY